MYDYQARVLRVIDGDTVKLDVDLGFGIHHHITCRLAAVNAPEANTEAGQRALYWLDDRLVQQDSWYIQSHRAINAPLSQDKYGRWIVVIHDPLGTTINAELIREGHAEPYP
jgi:micrococcal nuclease